MITKDMSIGEIVENIRTRYRFSKISVWAASAAPSPTLKHWKKA